MRLLRVSLPRFHDTGGLEIDFGVQRQEDPALSFLVGPNGSGKSRLLEAMGQIFAHVAAGVPPGFPFEVEYELGDSRVLLGTEKQIERIVDVPRLPQVGAWLLVSPADSFGGWLAEHAQRAWPTYLEEVLPFRVVGISSGPASRLQWALRDSVAASLSLRLGVGEDPGAEGIREQNREVEMEEEIVREKLAELVTEPHCLAIEGRELALAMLALLSHPRSRQSAILERDEILRKAHLSVGSLQSFSFEIVADWRARLPPGEQRMFATFMEQAVRRVGLARSSADGEQRDLRTVFVYDEALGEWIDQYAKTPFRWFTRLHTWLKTGALRTPELLLHLPGREGLVRHFDLSDGEFLYVGRYALLLLLREHKGCLVLLDEPETHFNDRWKIDLVYDMARIMQGSQTQLVLATHSDLTLTDADRSDVFVFDDDYGGDGVNPAPPSISPLGADRSEITQQVFGARSASGRRATEIVEHALEHKEPAELEDTLRRLGPGFQRFRLRYAIEREGEDRDAS